MADRSVSVPKTSDLERPEARNQFFQADLKLIFLIICVFLYSFFLCALQWNALRWYGYVRMQHLTANWKVLDEINMRDVAHFLYVLQKVD